jgi:hypothetical protein
MPKTTSEVSAIMARKEIAKRLEARCSWLTDQDMDADGADTVDAMAELHESLKDGKSPWN